MTGYADDFDGYVDNIDSVFIYLFIYLTFLIPNDWCTILVHAKVTFLPHQISQINVWLHMHNTSLSFFLLFFFLLLPAGYWDQCSRLLCSDCDCNFNLAGSEVDGAAGADSHHIWLSVVRTREEQNSRREPVVFHGSREQGEALQQEGAERQGMQESKVGRGGGQWNVTLIRYVNQSINHGIILSYPFPRLFPTDSC